jgi:hypothetical protein
MIILRTTWSSSIDMSDGMHRVFTTFCIVMKRKLKVSSDGQQFRKYQQNEQSSHISIDEDHVVRNIIIDIMW